MILYYIVLYYIITYYITLKCVIFYCINYLIYRFNDQVPLLVQVPNFYVIMFCYFNIVPWSGIQKVFTSIMNNSLRALRIASAR